jgi:hypothetical protein
MKVLHITLFVFLSITVPIVQIQCATSRLSPAAIEAKTVGRVLLNAGLAAVLYTALASALPSIVRLSDFFDASARKTLEEIHGQPIALILIRHLLKTAVYVCGVWKSAELLLNQVKPQPCSLFARS